jgi:hypothetical protein
MMLTLRQAAERSEGRVSYENLRKLVTQRKGPIAEKFGGRYLIDEVQLQRWIEIKRQIIRPNGH